MPSATRPHPPAPLSQGSGGVFKTDTFLNDPRSLKNLRRLNSPPPLGEGAGG